MPVVHQRGLRSELCTGDGEKPFSTAAMSSCLTGVEHLQSEENQEMHSTVIQDNVLLLSVVFKGMFQIFFLLIPKTPGIPCYVPILCQLLSMISFPLTVSGHCVYIHAVLGIICKVSHVYQIQVLILNYTAKSFSFLYLFQEFSPLGIRFICFLFFDLQFESLQFIMNNEDMTN